MEKRDLIMRLCTKRKLERAIQNTGMRAERRETLKAQAASAGFKNVSS